MGDKDQSPLPEERDDRTIFRPLPLARPAAESTPKSEEPPVQSEDATKGLAFNDDRTIFRPNPAGRRSVDATVEPALKPSAPPPRQPAVQGQDLAAPNDNPVMRAAGPLLLLLGRLRTSLLRVPGSGLTAQIAAAMETCDRAMKSAGVAPEEANTARYVLCATADEVLANLPGADRNPTARSGLMTRFFGESNGGRRFFDELDRVEKNPRAHYFLLELFHACLALGFQGAHQTLPGGAATLLDIRHGLYELLQKTRPAAARPLSAHWQGQALASHAVRLRVPLWTAAGLIALLLFGVFIGFRISLSHRTEAAAASLNALNPVTPVTIGRKVAVAPPPPPPPTQAQVSQLDHIRDVLGPNIAAGTISVDSTANQIVIRITDRALFRPGKSAILDDVRPLMMYIALALDDERAVKVIGHSDNTPISNARFASNFELSLERAKVVGALLKQSLSRPDRVEAEGKGADVPIASNDTSEGRTKNRRVEIVVPRSD
jgi:type VI secretion system protein ImpK